MSAREPICSAFPVGYRPEGVTDMISAEVELGDGVVIHHPELVNLYGCKIGARTRLGAFVEIQKNAVVGADCKISSHSFICEAVTIEDDVFIGHGVMFTNDRYPRATTADRKLQTEADWDMLSTRVETGASIGSNATILPGVSIGRHAQIGAGAVVTRDIPAFAVAAGVPARVIGWARDRDPSAFQTGAQS